MLVDLPPDLLQEVLDRCGPKTLAQLAGTCRTLRRETRAKRRELAVFMREKGETPTQRREHSRACVRWLAAWAPHVHALKVRGNVLASPLSRWNSPVQSLVNLRHLHVSCAPDVNDRILQFLPPGVESVSIRKLRPQWPGSPLSTSCLDRYTALRRVAFTLHRDYSAAHLNHRSLALDALFIERAPAIVVLTRLPPVAESLHLCAVDTLDGFRGTLPLAPRTRIKCMETDVDAAMFDETSLPRVERLSLSCPWRAWPGFIADMPALEELHLQLDIANIDLLQLRELPRLGLVRIRTRFGYNLRGDGMRLPRRVSAELYVDGERQSHLVLSEP